MFNLLRNKSRYVACHSGLDPESSLFAFLDSCLRRNDIFDAAIYVKKCWTHYTSDFIYCRSLDL